MDTMQAMYMLFRISKNPKLSSSFSDVSCSSKLCKALRNSRYGNGCCEYLNVYGDRSSSQGFLSRETLTFEE